MFIMVPQEDEEEDEDIDSLVSFHKRKMASSSSSLHSSKVKYWHFSQLVLVLWRLFEEQLIMSLRTELMLDNLNEHL